jgi:hypothetical protein
LSATLIKDRFITGPDWLECGSGHENENQRL